MLVTIRDLINIILPIVYRVGRRAIGHVSMLIDVIACLLPELIVNLLVVVDLFL